ncbi:MAG: response regulator receiver domain [Gammaproteobacteria bacterium]|nr:response regulator receiver domain [Gammaproteobacteria bacterium]
MAQRFLQTAVVVDDEAHMARGETNGPRAEVVAPSRHTPPSRRDDQGPVGRGPMHTLNAGSITDSFSALGVICGVVGPTGSAMETMRQADIVVLDWLLQDGDPRYALELLRGLLAGEVDRNSLRLVAIYTGEARLEEICAAVSAELKEAGLDPVENETKTEVSYRHGRVVLYAKSGVNLAEPLRERSVAEEEFPGRLVEDFASMTEGLLPGIALTSLSAVREGEHKILDRFCAELDPAFLAYMACLPDPEDAERQIVTHVAEELRGLMDNAVADESPAGVKVVEGWIRCKGDRGAGFRFGERELDLQQTVELATKGLEASDLGKSAFKHLSAGFAGCDVVDLDEQLAWIMSFRTVFNAPPPTLWLGSVVTTVTDTKEAHLICMRPRCDCVRLDKETTFNFLPLVAPSKFKEFKDLKIKEQVVTKVGEEFMRLGIGLDPSGWILRQFQPTGDNRAVIATRREPDGGFEFTDACGTRYVWQGELKAEYAQRIAQTFATTLSRVAVDESEWLRRMAGRG